MQTRIVMDSAGDIKNLPGADFVCVPLKIMTDSREFVDDENIDVEQMVDYLYQYKGRTTTACPSVGEYLEAFGDAENVYCITITSQLSGSYNAASIAAQTYREQHPDRNVFVFDTMSAGPEMTLLSQRISALVSQKLSFSRIVEEAKAYLEKTRLVFSLESLNNLANNGRVPSPVAKLAGILSLRLIGIAQDGKLKPVGKARGEKKVAPELLKFLSEMGFAGGKVLISHCMNLGGADHLRQLILEKFPNSQVSVGTTGGLCGFYAEKGGLLVGFETGT